MNLRIDARFDRAVSWLDARGHWFALVCLAALTLALYHNALSGWWTNDDPLHLKEAILHSPAEYFFVPRVWQELIAAVFTPLLTLSYDFDYTLFGLNPAPFYAHQLVSVALAAFAFYLLLTLWVPRSFALVGAMLLLVSSPFALAAAWLAVRHYIEGLALASIALYLWVLGLRHQKPVYRWGSAVLYLLAMLAKEVYVPLAGLLVLVPESTWRKRLRASWLHWLVLAVFLLWRFWMLGGQFGGYGLFSTNWETAPDTVVLVVALLPITCFLMLFGVTWFAPVFAGILGATLVALVRTARLQRLAIVLAMLMLVSAPLIPVIGDFSPAAPAVSHRFVTVPAIFFIFAMTVGLAHLGPVGQERILALMVLISVGVGLGWQSRSVMATWHDPVILKQEGLFLLERPPETDVLSVGLNMDFYYRGIHWLRAHIGNGEAPATVAGGYFGLEPDHDASPLVRRFYRYEPQCDCFQDRTANALNEREQVMRRRAERPLQASVEWGKGWLIWSLGPYEKGKYFLLAGQHSDYYSSRREVARRGSRAYWLEGFMRVGYESPEGWITLSPEFRVNLAEPGRFDWSSNQMQNSVEAPASLDGQMDLSSADRSSRP